MDKLLFITKTFPEKLKALNPSTAPVFGKMNVQQMIEHMSDSFREANGKVPRELVTPADKLELFRTFILSEREFKPNTKNALMGDEPLPAKHTSIDLAVKELESEISDFVKYFRENPDANIMNPFFGPLNFEQWTHLLHKHAIHHLKQFEVMI